MSDTTLHPELDGIGTYEYGWSDSDVAGTNVKRGLDEDVVRDISSKKSEPQWMLDLRLKAPIVPARAITAASRSCCFALRTSCLIPRRVNTAESSSDFSTETVPTRTG